MLVCTDAFDCKGHILLKPEDIRDKDALSTVHIFNLYNIHIIPRPATIHFSMIQYVTQETKQEGYCFVSCSWAQKSVQLTSLVGSTHAFVVSAILNITLNTAQHGFFSSVCLENRCA